MVCESIVGGSISPSRADTCDCENATNREGFLCDYLYQSQDLQNIAWRMPAVGLQDLCCSCSRWSLRPHSRTPVISVVIHPARWRGLIIKMISVFIDTEMVARFHL